MIESKFDGTLKVTGENVVNDPVGVTLFYDPDFDQIAVTMVFSVPGEEDSAWTVGRDLLKTGSWSHYPIGEGDARFCVKDTGDILIVCLRTPEGHADIHLPLAEVRAFLDEVYKYLPESSENFEAEVDNFLEEVLGGA